MAKINNVVSIDIGGTFTDFVMVNPYGEMTSFKVASTSQNPEVAVENCINKVMNDILGESLFVHGTTVATNALLERKGAKTGMLVTKGMRDIVEIQREDRSHLYDLHYRKSPPIVPREWRLEVEERLSAEGEVLAPINRRDIENAVEFFKKEGIESIVIGYLFSYIDDSHEKETEQIIKELWPEVTVTTSADALKMWKEFERFSTASINAYLKPCIEMYMKNLSEFLDNTGKFDKALIMQSNGGCTDFMSISERPIDIIMSGPAGGVQAAAHYGKMCGFPNVISFDVGGTSTDVCLIKDGTPMVSEEKELEYGHPILTPTIEVHTIGAGGGSIASVDIGGGIHVGPESAGAIPGPACYGRGGVYPTLTDADIVMGNIRSLKMNVETFDAKLAENALKKLGTAFGVDSAVEVAEGIIRIAVSNMVEAIRLVSVSQGYSPREFALVAFGGAGPIRACDIARELGMKNIIIAPHAGVLSAVGLQLSDIRHDYLQTTVGMFDEKKCFELCNLMLDIAEKGRRQLLEEGFDDKHQNIKFFIHGRYGSQTHDTSVRIDGEDIAAKDSKKIRDRFDSRYEELYGYALKDDDFEVTKIQVTGIGIRDKSQTFEKVNYEQDTYIPNPIGKQNVYLNGRFREIPLYNRDDLTPGFEMDGPFAVTSNDTSLLVHEDFRAKVHESNCIILELIQE